MIIQLPTLFFHRYLSDSVHLPNCQALMTFPEGWSQMADDSPIKAMFLKIHSPEHSTPFPQNIVESHSWGSQGCA